MYLRGLKRLSQTAFGQDVSFDIETYWDDTVGLVTTTYPIDVHQASASSYAKSFAIELWLRDVEKKGFGYNEDKYTLRMRFKIEKYIPAANRLIIEIPKRNYNLQQYDDSAVQYNDVSLESLGQDT